MEFPPLHETTTNLFLISYVLLFCCILYMCSTELGCLFFSCRRNWYFILIRMELLAIFCEKQKSMYVLPCILRPNCCKLVSFIETYPVFTYNISFQLELEEGGSGTLRYFFLCYGRVFREEYLDDFI